LAQRIVIFGSDGVAKNTGRVPYASGERLKDEFEPLTDQPEETIRWISAALLDVNVGFGVNSVLNTELVGNGFQHAGCDDELMLDSGHGLAAACAGAERVRAAITAAHAGADRRVIRRRNDPSCGRQSM
jgi:hypothetical protein